MSCFIFLYSQFHALLTTVAYLLRHESLPLPPYMEHQNNLLGLPQAKEEKDKCARLR